MSRVKEAVSANDRVGILNDLRGRMDSGELSPGSAFPSEREIADRYGVGRSMVRWAVGRLESEGRIRRMGLRTRVVTQRDVSSAPCGAPQKGILGNTVAVLAGSGETGEYMRPGVSAPGWQFYSAHGAIRRIYEKGLHVMRVNRTALTPDEVRDLVCGGIRAVVVPEFSVLNREMLEALKSENVPTVVGGDREESRCFDRVVSDHAAGAAMEVEWLAAHGRRRIVQLLSDTWKESYWQKARREGYERAAAKLGLEALPPIVVYPSGISDSVRTEAEIERSARFLAGYFVSAFRSWNPDALMLFSDEGVSAASLACRYCGRDPGREIALAGYDDFWSEHWTQKIVPFPPQVTIDKRNWDCGEIMADMALARAAGELPDEPQKTIAAPVLVEC